MSPANVSDLMCEKIRELGSEYVFLLPSATIDGLCAAIARRSDLTPIVVNNELSAGFMADGFARAGGRPAVAVVGGGPAAHYLLPAAVNARIENSPVLVLTGEAPTWMAGEAHFQNTGAAGSRDQTLFREGVDFSERVASVEQFDELWSRCHARLDAHLPAHMALPLDVQSFAASSTRPEPSNRPATSELSPGEMRALDDLADRWVRARSPLLVLGPRISQLKAPHRIERLVAACAAPVVTTIGARGCAPDDLDGHLGNFGYGGQSDANRAIVNPEYDHVLFVGGGPGARDGINWAKIAGQAPGRLCRIEIGAMSGGGGFRPEDDVRVASFDSALKYFCARVRNGGAARSGACPTERVTDETAAALPLEDYVRAIQDSLPAGSALVVDSGLHRKAATRAWRSRGDLDFFASPEQAPMGWAIGAAIGAKLARPERIFVCLTGDGCMRMLGLEIATAARYRIPVIFVVANNAGFGSITLRGPDKRYSSTFGDLERVDWVSFSNLFGGRGRTVKALSEIGPAIGDAVAHEGPYVVDLQLPRNEPEGAADVWGKP